MAKSGLKEYTTLVNIIKKVRIFEITFPLLESLLWLIGGLLGGALGVAIAFYLWPEVVNFKIWFLVLIGVLSGIIIGRVWYNLKKFTLRSEKTILRIQKRLPILKDDLINAFQLGKGSPSYFSQTLIKNLVQETVQKLTKIPLKRILPKINLKKASFLILSVIPFWLLFITFKPSIFNLFGKGELSKIIKISPEDISILKGEALKIKVSSKQALFSTPILAYKFQTKKWQKVRMKPEENFFSYLLADIEEPLEYFVKWQNYRSPRYFVKIITPPRVGNISLKYYPPQYTGLPPQEVPNPSGQIEALLGTRVEIRARSTNLLKEAYLLVGTPSGEQKQKAEIEKNGQGIKAELILDNQTWYEIEVRDRQGYSNKNRVRHSIEILPDSIPEVELLNPSPTFITFPQGKLKLTYKIRDDFGITKVAFCYQKEKERGEKIIKRFPIPARKGLFDFEFPLAPLGLKPAQSFSYWLTVWDNDTISGPKSGSSKKYYLQIISFKEKRTRLRQKEKLLQEKFIEAATRQELAYNQLTIEAFRQSLKEQQTVTQVADKAGEILQDILKELQDTPSAFSGVKREFLALEEALRYLKETKLPQAEHLLQKLKKGAIGTTLNKALTLQEEIASEFHRLAQKVDEIRKMENLAEFLTSTSELTHKVKAFEKALSQGQKEELEKLLSQISASFNKLLKSLLNAAQKLPPDFAENKAIKKIPLDRFSELLAQLQESLAQGNFSQALEYAQALSELLSELMSATHTAANWSYFSSLKKVAEELKKALRQLEKIIKKEEKLVKDTRQLLQKHASLSKLELKDLKELSEKEWKLLKRLRRLEKSSSPRLRTHFKRTKQVIGEILRGLNSPSPEKALPLFKEASRSLSLLKDRVVELRENASAYRKRVKEKIGLKQLLRREIRLRALEKEIARIKQSQDRLGQEFFPEYKKIFTKGEKEKLETLAKKQKTVAEKTKKLISTLKASPRSFQSWNVDNLKRAKAEMEKASKNLKTYEAKQALTNERQALYYLKKTANNLKTALQGLLQMKQSVFIIPQLGLFLGRGGAPGRLGVREGYVRIPQPGEDETREAFRKQLLKALKERYPRVYEELIKGYYQKLLE
jgi:hypothetical protein